jgi:hypothetical protein
MIHHRPATPAACARRQRHSVGRGPSSGAALGVSVRLCPGHRPEPCRSAQRRTGHAESGLLRRSEGRHTVADGMGRRRTCSSTDVRRLWRTNRARSDQASTTSVCLRTLPADFVSRISSGELYLRGVQRRSAARPRVGNAGCARSVGRRAYNAPGKSFTVPFATVCSCRRLASRAR